MNLSPSVATTVIPTSTVVTSPSKPVTICFRTVTTKVSVPTRSISVPALMIARPLTLLCFSFRIFFCLATNRIKFFFVPTPLFTQICHTHLLIMSRVSLIFLYCQFCKTNIADTRRYVLTRSKPPWTKNHSCIVKFHIFLFLYRCRCSSTSSSRITSWWMGPISITTSFQLS